LLKDDDDDEDEDEDERNNFGGKMRRNGIDLFSATPHATNKMP